MIVDLFAGPGGWDEGLRLNGRTDVLGIELDRDACNTATANGHQRRRGDVFGINPTSLAGRRVELVAASSPCGPWSKAGDRHAHSDLDDCRQALADVAAGDNSTRSEYLMTMRDHRTILIVEPLRYVLALDAEALVMEQTVEAMPIFAEYAVHLRARGWSVDYGTVNAADFGVGQTRMRAAFVGHRDRAVRLPAATHRGRWETIRSVLAGSGWVPPFGEDTAWRTTQMRNVAVRGLDEPAPTLAFGHEFPRWVSKPAGQEPTKQQWNDGVHVLSSEAGALQSFPLDYQWRGTRTDMFLQIANAVPPLLAQAVTAVVLDGVSPLPTSDRQDVTP